MMNDEKLWKEFKKDCYKPSLIIHQSSLIISLIPLQKFLIIFSQCCGFVFNCVIISLPVLEMG